MTILWQDLRFALRTLTRSRGFTLVALATLALGIGVNTAMFSVAHAVLWRSMPYPQPDRLIMVGEVDAHHPDQYWGASYPNLRDWRERSTVFEHLAGVMSSGHILREGSEPVFSRFRRRFLLTRAPQPVPLTLGHGPADGSQQGGQPNAPPRER